MTVRTCRRRSPWTRPNAVFATVRRRLLPFPALCSKLLAPRIGPDALPAIALLAVQRKTGVIAGAIGHCEEIGIADAGAVVALAGHDPGDPVGVAGALDRHL